MSILDLLCREPDTKVIVLRCPRRMDHGLEALCFMQQPEAEKEDLIIEAIEEYLQRRLWAAKEKELDATQLQRAPSFKGNGIRQRRDY